jgi:hypothetical protein
MDQVEMVHPFWIMLEIFQQVEFVDGEIIWEVRIGGSADIIIKVEQRECRRLGTALSKFNRPDT